MQAASSPLAVLSLIVAPAVLTNASSLLAMSTSNRFARAVDRARELSRQLEEASDYTSEQALRRLQELSATERRTLMLLAALRSFYIALGCFATAALFALLGAVAGTTLSGSAVQALQTFGIVAGLCALGALVYGASVLVRETRIVVQVLHERAAGVKARVAAAGRSETRPAKVSAVPDA